MVIEVNVSGDGIVQLAEVFEADIDGVMRSLGYCCGRKHIFSPQVLCCYGKQLCAIPRDTVYYNYQNRFVDYVSLLRMLEFVDKLFVSTK